MAAKKSIKEINNEIKENINFADTASWNGPIPTPTDNIELSFNIESAIVGKNVAFDMAPPSDITFSVPTITLAGNQLSAIGKSLDIPKLIVQASLTIGEIITQEPHGSLNIHMIPGAQVIFNGPIGATTIMFTNDNGQQNLLNTQGLQIPFTIGYDLKVALSVQGNDIPNESDVVIAGQSLDIED